MKSFALLSAFLLFSALINAPGAYSAYAVNALLGRYSVPSTLINSLSYVNLSYAGTSYLGLYVNGSPNFIVNLTGNYSLVLNASSVANIISSKTIADSLSNSNFSRIRSQMVKYELSGGGPISDCLVETGLSTGTTCTIANYCASCEFIPNCKTVLIETHGATGPFGVGIMQFARQYAWMNTSFNTFFNASSNVSAGNVAGRLGTLTASYANVSNLTHNIFYNPIFPPTANITPNQVAGCSSYLNISTAPWYCSALGYCENVNYNYTKLNYVGLLLNQTRAMPFTKAQMSQIAQNVSNEESRYVYPVLSQQRRQLLNLSLSKNVPMYGSLVNNSAALLGRISNATLQGDLTALESNYGNVTSNYLTVNFTRANATLALQYAKLLNDYTRLNATYASVLGYAANNTAKILELQLYGSENAQLSDLALQQLAINAQLSSGPISNITGISTRLSGINSKLSSYSTSPLTLTELARGIDTPFITGMASTLGLAYPTAVGAAPLFGSLLSLIIGIALLACLFLYHSYLAGKHKIAVNPRTAKNWRTVFVLFGCVVLVYIALTYLLLADANSSAPFSTFQSAYAHSKTLAIAINGTPTLGETNCAGRISAQATSAGKKVTLASFSSGLCRSGNATSTVGSCLSSYANAGTPVVVLTNGSRAGISLYSLYGTVLSVSGNDTVMNTCYVALLTG